MFQNEGVENRSKAAEKLCPTRGPSELTFRLDKMEVIGDFDEQLGWNDRDKCPAGVDQRAKAQVFPRV